MARGSPSHAQLGIVILACVAGAVSAVGAITAAEQFPGEGRVSGLALGATTATAVFGGLTPYVAQILTERTGWNLVPGAMIALVGLCALPVMIMLPETAPGKLIARAATRQSPPKNSRPRLS
jgi:MHS family proline/betaine transporter-like MFS transporter